MTDLHVALFALAAVCVLVLVLWSTDPAVVDPIVRGIR